MLAVRIRFLEISALGRECTFGVVDGCRSQWTTDGRQITVELLTATRTATSGLVPSRSGG